MVRMEAKAREGTGPAPVQISVATRQKFPPLAGAVSLCDNRRSVAQQAALEDTLRKRDHPRRSMIVKEVRQWHRRRHHQSMEKSVTLDFEQRGFEFDLRLAGQIRFDRLTAFTHSIHRRFAAAIILRRVAMGVLQIRALNLGERAMIGHHQPRKQHDSHDEAAADRCVAKCFHHETPRAQTRATINNKLHGQVAFASTSKARTSSSVVCPKSS